MALPAILPNQNIPPLARDQNEERGPFDPPAPGDRFELVWYLFFQAVAEFIQNGGGGGGSGTVARYALTTATTTITAAVPADGDRLTVFVTPNASSGRAIAWDTMFATDTSKNFNPASGKQTTFDFVGEGGLWHQSAYAVMQP